MQIQVKLSALPSELLLYIIERINVKDLLCAIPLVSRAFYDLKVIACNRRRTLTIQLGTGSMLRMPFTGDYFYHKKGQSQTSNLFKQKPKYSVLKFRTSEISEQVIDAFADTFPEIGHLQLSIGNLKLNPRTSLYRLSGFLEMWQYSLKSLHIICRFDESVYDQFEISFFYYGLFEHMNKICPIKQLKSLRFCVRNKMRLEVLPPLDLPILGQLEEFYFASLDTETQFLYDSLRKYAAPNERLKRIGLECPIARRKDNLRFLFERALTNEVYSKLAQKCTHLSFKDFPLNFPEKTLAPYLLNIRDTTPSLCSLSIKLRKVSLALLFSSLQPLTVNANSNLIALKLSITDTLLLTDPNFEKLHQLSTKDSPVQHNSIQYLLLQYNLQSHEIIRDMRLEIFFPNLQVAMIDNHGMQCHSCGYAKQDGKNNKDQMKREQCRQNVKNCLSQKANLKFLYR